MVKRPQRHIEYATLPHSGLLYGDHKVIRPAIDQVGCRHQYDDRRHAYLVSIKWLDDVLARIELAGHFVTQRLGA